MIWRFAKKFTAAILLLAIIGMSGLAIVTRIQGGKLLSVQTESMVPALNKGDLVSVKRVPAENLKVGDIITFINPRNSKQTITHRIVELPSAYNAKKLITKGDANPDTDFPVDTTAVLGGVKYSLPKVGYASDFIRQPLGLAILIYVPAIAIIIAELRRLSAYYKAQVYTVPGRTRSNYTEESELPSSVMTAAKFMPLLLIACLFIAVPVHALLKTQASLIGNRITAVRPTPPPTTGCQNSSNGTSTNTTVNVSGGGSNNVNVSNSTDQSAQTGSATNSGNTNGGSATSGNASNCNSTTTTIVIH